MFEYVISPNGYVMVTIAGGGTRFLNRHNIVSIHVASEVIAETGQIVDVNLIIRMANMKADCIVSLQDIGEGTEFIKELTGIVPPQEEPRQVVPGFNGPR